MIQQLTLNMLRCGLLCKTAMPNPHLYSFVYSSSFLLDLELAFKMGGPWKAIDLAWAAAGFTLRANSSQVLMLDTCYIFYLYLFLVEVKGCLLSTEVKLIKPCYHRISRYVTWICFIFSILCRCIITRGRILLLLVLFRGHLRSRGQMLKTLLAQYLKMTGYFLHSACRCTILNRTLQFFLDVKGPLFYMVHISV